MISIYIWYIYNICYIYNIYIYIYIYLYDIYMIHMYDISHIYIVHYQDENNAAFFQFLWCPLCPCQALDASTDAVAPLWAQLQLILSAAAQARAWRARRGHGAGTARARRGHGGHGVCVRLCLVAAHCVHCAHRGPHGPRRHQRPSVVI